MAGTGREAQAGEWQAVRPSVPVSCQAAGPDAPFGSRRATPNASPRPAPPSRPQLRGHPNILRLHAAAFAGPKGAESDAFLLVDHCPDTLLAAMQRAGFQLDERTLVDVFSCVAAGIAHMHRQAPPLAHRCGAPAAGACSGVARDAAPGARPPARHTPCTQQPATPAAPRSPCSLPPPLPLHSTPSGTSRRRMC